MAYKHSTFIQRCRIHGLWRVGHNQTEIAKEIGVHKSTISREFKRNIFWWNSRIPQYKPHYAQSYTENRHKNKLKQQRCCRNGRSSSAKSGTSSASSWAEGTQYQKRAKQQHNKSQKKPNGKGRGGVKR